MPKKAPVEPYTRPIHYEKPKKKFTISPAAAVLCLVAVWYVVIGRSILPQALTRLYGSRSPAANEKVYYDFTCSEANLARILALTLGTGESKEDSSLSEELWYEKYYKILDDLSITSLRQEDAFSSLSSSKLKQVLMEVFGEAAADSHLEDKEQIKLGEVLEIYDNLLQTEGKQLQSKAMTILATPADEAELEPWQLVSDQGLFYFEGLVVDPVKSKTLKAATWDNQLLGIIELKETSCFLKECKIIEVKDDKVKFEINGSRITYEQKNAVSAEDVGKIGNMIIEENKITAFSTEANHYADTLVSVGKNQLTLEKAGTFTYGNISFYNQTDKNYASLTDLPYGTRISYTLEGNQITSIQVLEGSTQADIRIVLTNKGNYVQNQVTLTADADYDLLYGGKASTLAAGEVWQSEAFGWDGKNMTVRLVPRTDSLLTVTSLEKSEGAPAYKGAVEIRKTDSGYLLINEVDLENYVAGVISSEMPTDYNLEALKAQAIAARTYGAACLAGSRFNIYGANADDTTASQVYNQIPADEAALKAVKETAGMVLRSEGELISNKFFGTSCGYTANAGEVWAGDSFPGSSPGYLISRQQYLGDKIVSDLQNEENFKTFIELDKEDIDAFDEESPWFRWKVSLTKEELQNLIIPALGKIRETYPERVSYESREGVKAENPDKDLGNIIRIKAEQRGEGGNLMTLGIYTEKEIVKVSTEYLIRCLFASNEQQGLIVTRADESRIKNMSLLPSAFFTIKEEKDAQGNLQGVTLEGGGNGHGVGMSQDGAQGMAERGYGTREILTHYYPDSELVQFQRSN